MFGFRLHGFNILQPSSRLACLSWCIAQGLDFYLTSLPHSQLTLCSLTWSEEINPKI